MSTHTNCRGDSCRGCAADERMLVQCDDCGEEYLGEHDCPEAGETVYPTPVRS